MMLNIGRDNTDKSYRYKMPQLQSKIEGRGNGIKTVIPNMPDIAKSLHTHPAYPTKYFGIELGAQSNYMIKTERAIVNGAHQAADLQKLMGQFVDTFILCPKCHLPEIKWKVTSKKIVVDCAACGYNGELKTAHKLATYIMKNPPDAFAGDGKGSDKKSGKKERKGKKGRGGDDEDEDGEDGAEEKEAPEPADAVEDVKEEEPKPKKKEEVEWFSDTSKEAQAQRKAKEISDMAKKEKALVADLTKETPANVLRLFMQDRPRNANEVVSEVRRLQMSRGLDDSQKVQVLVQALIDTTKPKTVPEQFKKHCPILKQFALDAAASKGLICALEDLMGVVDKKCAQYMPHVLKVLYEEDVLDEDTLVRWYEAPAESDWVDKSVAADMRARAKPVIDWLREADEDEDDEEDEEEDK